MTILKTLAYSALTLMSSQALAVENLDYSLRADSYASLVDSTQVESRVVGLYLHLDSQYKLAPSVSFKLLGGALLETGTDRSLWLSEFSPDQQVVLEEAKFVWQPLSYFNLHLGALNQREYDLPTLVSDSAFVGAREEFKVGLGDSRSLSLLSQQALPSNQTLSNRLGNVESGTPKFFFHRLGLDLDGDLVALSAYAGLFEYSDLSEGVAQRSRFLGNSVLGVSANNATFLYSYKGHFYGGSLKWYINEDIDIGLKGHLLENSDAPSRRSRARFGELSFHYHLATFSVASFRLESDASVAFYNNKIMGHNNREGLLFTHLYKASLFDLKIQYSTSDIISASPYQGKQTAILIALSKVLF